MIEAVGVFRAVDHLEGDDSLVCVAGSHYALGLVKDSIPHTGVQDRFSVICFGDVFDDGFVGADFVFHCVGVEWPFWLNKSDAPNGSKGTCRVFKVSSSPSPDPKRYVKVGAL